MDVIFWEWASFAIRWLHVIAGIAWIGSSFYFIHLDLSLRKREGLPEGAGGEAWQVHGGGFYHMVKYTVAPARLPEELTWFKWEAYTTWLSGIVLLVVVYYLAADLYLVDPRVLDIPGWAAILVSFGGIMLGWVVYDALCKSPLRDNEWLLAGVGFLFIALTAFVYQFIFSGRGAFMQTGAIIGTIMVANVAHVIIPNQRKVVADLKAGKAPDPALGIAAKQRSLHNNYLTLPVIYVMIGNHYPLAFAGRYMWLMLAIVLIVGAAIRHFFNMRHKGLPSPWWTWAVALAGMLGVAWLSSFPATFPEEDDVAAAEAAPIVDAAVEEIVISRCSMCHMAEPVWEGVGVPPKGVMLETPRQIALHRHAIGMQAVRTHAMPPANVTGITEGERRTLAAWLEAPQP